ncbi:hypothetical protein [Streptomyces sp. NPDC052042]|uniref:hypothetical protein n=1 Tax=Streptomyces sp. NPDC052042 TaxID=3365683 RepID=UPI0037D08F32
MRDDLVLEALVSQGLLDGAAGVLGDLVQQGDARGFDVRVRGRHALPRPDTTGPRPTGRTTGAFALSLIRTTALDEAARHAPGADGPPPANWELHRALTETLESWQEDGTLRESSLLLVEWLIAELCAYVAGQVGDRACEHRTRLSTSPDGIMVIVLIPWRPREWESPGPGNGGELALSRHASTNPEGEARRSFRDGLRLFRLPPRIVYDPQEFLDPEGNRDVFDPEEQLVGLWGPVWLWSSDQRTRASASGPTKCKGGSPRRNRSTSSTALAPSR